MSEHRRPGATPGRASPDGFDEFVRAAYPGLVHLGALLTGDAHHGEDLAQMGLVKTLGAWRRLHPDGHPEAYTRVVMTHLAARAGRRRWRGERPTEDLPDTPAAGRALADDVATAVDARRMLATLPSHQRIVLVLRFWLDHSEADTAALLGCSVGTVKSRTHRALAALRASAPEAGPTDADADVSPWTGAPR